MANRPVTTDRKEMVIIDTAPGVNGYWSNIVNANSKKVENLFFAIRDISESDVFEGVVTLQWRQRGEELLWEKWQLWDIYNSPRRQPINDYSAEVQWRAGVQEGDYISGTIAIGFNW